MSRTEGVDAAAFRGFERAAHDKIAASYHEHFSGLTNLAIAPLLTAVSLRHGSNLLEVAAGTGSLAAAAKQHGAGRVLATDLSPNMVALAARLHPSLEFLEADVENLPVADGSFDCVVCNFGLGHFPAPERAVMECVRTLRSGGRLAFSWWDKPDRQRFQGMFLEAMAEAGAQAPTDIPAGPPMFRYSEDNSFAGLLASSGLSSVSILTHAAHHRLAGVDALWEAGLGSLARTGTVIKSQSEDVQHRIKSALSRLAEGHLINGALVIPVSFKIGAGSKI
jgi:SAM-dependent methyltransferase